MDNDTKGGFPAHVSEPAEPKKLMGMDVILDDRLPPGTVLITQKAAWPSRNKAKPEPEGTK